MPRVKGPEKKQVLLRFELPIHDELSRKADSRGKSLPEYLQDFITAHAVSTSKNDISRVGTLDRAEVATNFSRPRKWFYRRFPPDPATAQLVHAQGVHKLGMMIACPWCSGFYISGLVVLAVSQSI